MQGIILLLEAAYKYFDPLSHRKNTFLYIHFFIMLNFLLLLHFFNTFPKKCFEYSKTHTRFRIYITEFIFFLLQIN